MTIPEITNDQKLIKRIPLDNGLELKLFDASRKMIGDRWLIKLVASVEVSVQKLAELSVAPPFDLKEMLQLMGEKVTFIQERKRNFVEQDDRESVLQEMIDSFVISLKAYLSHPDFAKKLLLKEYLQRKQRANWTTSG